MVRSVHAVISSQGNILGFTDNFSITIGSQKEKDYSYRIDLRSNLAFLKRGQELVNLKFKGNVNIKKSKVVFTEDGDFVFSIKGVVFKQTKSLKDMTTHLSGLLEL